MATWEEIERDYGWKYTNGENLPIPADCEYVSFKYSPADITGDEQHIEIYTSFEILNQLHTIPIPKNTSLIDYNYQWFYTTWDDYNEEGYLVHPEYTSRLQYYLDKVWTWWNIKYDTEAQDYLPCPIETARLKYRLDEVWTWWDIKYDPTDYTFLPAPIETDRIFYDIEKIWSGWYFHVVEFYGCITPKEHPKVLGAFAYTGIETIEIPPTVKFIGEFAFHQTPLRYVKLARDCIYFETSFPPNCRIEYWEDR